MTETGDPAPHVSAAGRLAIAGHRLEHQIREVSEGLGVPAASTRGQDLIPALVLALKSIELPPWRTPDLAASDIRSFLDSAAAVLRTRDRYIAALAARPASPSMLGPATGTLMPLTVQDVDDLTSDCETLTLDGDAVVHALGYRHQDGGYLFGYRSIAHHLYHSATSHPATQPAT